MIKSTLWTFLCLALSSTAFAKNIACSIVNESNTSTLLIEYVAEAPENLYLKSPMSDEYRLQELQIVPVSLGEDADYFSAKPKLKEPIDWNREPGCFKSIGTQWYFALNFKEQAYSVQLAPLFELENDQCIPPRFRPQEKELDCQVSK